MDSTMAVRVDHDNGNHVSMRTPDGKHAGTYIRQDRVFYGADGIEDPRIGALMAALDLHVRGVAV